MTDILSDKRIVLGVTGSVACFKAVELASRLTQAGAIVDVILTTAGARFVGPESFSAVTGRAVHTDMWAGSERIMHVALAEEADIVVIAPATAHTMAKLVNGLADNLLTLIVLSSKARKLVAPAMDVGMYANQVTQNNVAELKSAGIFIAGPAEGRMASGLSGLGRMLEPEQIVDAIRTTLGRDGLLSGRSILVTAGPTREHIDPARFISNPSTGKQGVALARTALELGADVTMINGPLSIDTPWGVRRIDVTSAEEMRLAVLDEMASHDVLIMSAAVADIRPKQKSDHKLRKREILDNDASIELEPTRDILRQVHSLRVTGQRPFIVIGFAAETGDTLEGGLRKLREKGLDLIAINDIGASDSGFAVDTNQLTILDKAGSSLELPLSSKEEAALGLLKLVGARLAKHAEKSG